MIKSNVIEKLMKFQLTRPEATVYLCLLENGPLTGYEVSKLTGISRSNVYGSLNVLVDKGGAMLEEGGNTTHFAAVSPDEFMEGHLRSLEKERQYLLSHIGKRLSDQEGYLTVRGAANITNKAIHMIDACGLRLYLMASADIVEELVPALKRAWERGLKIVIISDRSWQEISTACYKDCTEGGQIRLITDSSYVLTGKLTGRDSDTCLYSGQENLVNVMKEALRNKIRLLEAEKDL